MITKINEFKLINEANSTFFIAPEDGSWKLSETEKNVLKKVFIAGIRGNQDKISNAHYFNSGYKGISFSINNTSGYYLMVNMGHVGLEDHFTGGISLSKGGNTIFSVAVKDDYTKSFGDLPKLEDSHLQEAIIKLQNFINSLNTKNENKVNESTSYECRTCGERAEHEEIEENPNMKCGNCGDSDWGVEQ